MSRAETRTPQRLEEYAREVERRANAALAELHYAATDSEIEDAVRDIIPADWEWINASYLSGPPMIAITRYSRPSF